jgi:hypothetical protein
MQIDFHHAVTYVAARGAGFSHEEADVVAYAAQYVDDAVSDGTVCFDNKAMYTRISSAHKTVDPQNLNDASNHLVWLPFHFLPGNGGTAEKGKVGNSFIDKIVCLPGDISPVAQKMLDLTMENKGKRCALHRLGITMHVYADTWAHQGFAGVLHPVNEVDEALETENSGVFEELSDEITSWIGERVIPPLGHGRAQVLPDMPFLKWQYKNCKGDTIARDNTEQFCKAADEMCRFMQRYRGQTVTGLPVADVTQIRELFLSAKDQAGAKRHRVWLDAISAGKFSFGPATITYDNSGRDSWKAKALGTACDLPVHSYPEDFLDTDWKMFHDAIQQHRLSLLHDILPLYGICAA